MAASTWEQMLQEAREAIAALGDALEPSEAATRRLLDVLERQQRLIASCGRAVVSLAGDLVAEGILPGYVQPSDREVK